MAARGTSGLHAQRGAAREHERRDAEPEARHPARHGLALGRWQGSAAASLGVAWVNLQADRNSGQERHTALPLWVGGAVRGAYLFSGGEAGLELGYSQAQVHEEAIRGNAAGLRASLGYLFHL